MKINLLFFYILFFTLCCFDATSQIGPGTQLLNPEVYQGVFVKKTVPLRDFIEPPFDGVIVREEKLGNDNPNPFDENPKLNDNALPFGQDPAWQKKVFGFNNTNSDKLKAINQNFDGLGYTNVNPPDPCADVGPNHVIQMVNASGGAVFSIWDRSGNNLQPETYFDSFTGIPGFGDPIVLYDEQADRWMMTEFAAGGNTLVFGVTETPDPLGAWYVYSYNTPIFPDYPKYSMWPNAYIVTTNEQAGGPNPAVYAFDRSAMLSGSPGTFQRFVAPILPFLSLQVLTPVDLDGSTQPPSGDPAILMRMVDDGWHSSIFEDRLDIFEFDIDWATPANTSLTLVQELSTAAFDTEFCGYGLSGCITQQGSPITFFALSQFLMNRISYKNFGTHETMVACHTVDVNGSNRGGIRWYELRKTPPSTDWVIYQQGTYAPTTDMDSRWLPTIAINNTGDIGLAYNVSGSTSYPSIMYTGRSECDPLNMMTEPETVIINGTAANGSNRYGDYNSLDVDEVDGSFWLTAEYNNVSAWSTRIANFSINNCGSIIAFSNPTNVINEGNSVVDNNCLDYQEVGITIEMVGVATVDPTVTIQITGDAISGIDYEEPSVLSATLTPSQLSHTFVFKIFNDGNTETLENIIIDYTLNANGGNAVSGTLAQTAIIEIIDDDLSPIETPGDTVEIFNEDFESMILSPFTSSNATGSQLFEVATFTDASTGLFNIPPPTSGSYIAYVNDDQCSCDLGQVYLEFPTIDLSEALSAELNFDCYFKGATFLGEQESCEVQVSIDGGTTYTNVEVISGILSWQSIVVNLNNYINEPNVNIRLLYSDVGTSIQGVAVDVPIVKTGRSVTVQLDVNSNMSDEQYLGPNSLVYFYDPNSNKVMLTIENTSSHDYGCTTVEVDRPGTNPTALEFSTSNLDEYVSSKTFKITPTNSNSSGTYNLSLYYEEEEILAWEDATGNNRSVMEIVKVAGDNHISDVTPANFNNYTISYNPVVLSSYYDDVIVSSTISSGFSGFGLGKPATTSNCENNLVNTWIGPNIGNWNDSVANWSLGMIPGYCDIVEIPANKIITIQAGAIGKGYTLDVVTGAEIITDQGGLLDIVAPQN